MTSMWLKNVERGIHSLWLQYDDADPERKHQILLSLRDEYRALPRCDQEKLWEIWSRWSAVFEREERANGTRVRSARRQQ
jgi:hypothetical protein